MSHRSISQLNLHQSCPRKYKYRYIDKFPEMPSENLDIGKSFDDGLTYIINEGQFSRENPTPSDALIEEAIKLIYKNAEELMMAHRFDELTVETIQSTLFHLAKLIGPYFQFRLPHKRFIPQQSQYQIMYELPEIEVPVKGYIDMIALDLKTDRLVIVDFKTSNSWTPSMDYKRQVWTYAKAVQEKEGLDYLPHTEIHIFNKTGPITKAKAEKLGLEGVPLHEVPEEVIEDLYTAKFIEDKTKIFEVPFKEAEFLAMREAFVDLEFSFKFNHWPKNRTHSLCQEKFCSFWAHCNSDSECQSSLELKKKMLQEAHLPPAIGTQDIPFSVESPVGPPLEIPQFSTNDDNFLF